MPFYIIYLPRFTRKIHVYIHRFKISLLFPDIWSEFMNFQESFTGRRWTIVHPKNYLIPLTVDEFIRSEGTERQATSTTVFEIYFYLESRQTILNPKMSLMMIAFWTLLRYLKRVPFLLCYIHILMFIYLYYGNAMPLYCVVWKNMAHDVKRH